LPERLGEDQDSDAKHSGSRGPRGIELVEGKGERRRRSRGRGRGRGRSDGSLVLGRDNDEAVGKDTDQARRIFSIPIRSREKGMEEKDHWERNK
jgi:hypothetical protein